MLPTVFRFFPCSVSSGLLYGLARVSRSPGTRKTERRAQAKAAPASSIDDPKAPNRALDKRNRLRYSTIFAYCADEGAAQIWLHAGARAISSRPSKILVLAPFV